MEVGKEMDEKGEPEIDEQKWVYDSSVDRNGRIPSRSETGVWRAALFIIAIEFSERMCYFGISTSLVTYLTKVLHQDIKTAAKNVNYWLGVTTMMPLLGGFLADGYLGRFSTVVISSVIYLLGLILLTKSQFIPSLKQCMLEQCQDSTKLHEMIFFIAMYLISMGTGGHKPALESFGADQFDEEHREERQKKMSYFNWWNFGLCCGLVIGVTVIVYVQENISFGIADTILLLVMSLSFIVFLIGIPFYRYKQPSGSPITPMVQVFVAAIAKRNLPHPPDPSHLYEISCKDQERFLSYTRKLRFLDKASILEDRGDGMKSPNPWRLATVTKVEETKLVLSMIPIWLTSLAFGICVAQTSTFFIKQGSTMHRKLTSNFSIPSSSIFTFSAFSMIISLAIYDRIFVPVMRKITRNERGVSILQRIGIGMFVITITMIISAIVERRRLDIAKRNPSKTTVPMSIFWLAPQFVMLGIGDTFALVGLQEYFYDQVPDTMRSLGIAFYLSVIGTSNFLSSFLIMAVDRFTGIGGSRSWFANDLNHSRLDCFYWLLAGINGVNVLIYAHIARRYTYKKTEKRVAISGSYDKEGP